MRKHFIKPILLEGEPCSHPGCLSHRTHPCEGCGRIGGRSTPTRGARINSLPELMMAAGSRRSVICPSSHVWGRPRPAAFLICLPARDVFHLINGGMFIYNKQPRVYRGWNVAKKAKPEKRYLFVEEVLP